MTEPSQRFTPSPLATALEVAASLWGVIVLGALRQADRVSVPAGPIVTGFVAGHGDEIERVKSLIRYALALPEDAMVAFDDAGRGLTESLDDAQGLATNLAISSRARGPWPLDVGDEALVGRLILHGLRCRLYGLVEALVLGVAGGHDDERISAVHEALTEAAALAGESDPAEATRRSYEAWSVAGLSEYLNPSGDATEQARADLRDVADRLDALILTDG